MTDVDLTRALCAALGDIDGWAYRETEPYTADVVGIFYGAIDTQPDRAVGVRVYDSHDYPRDHIGGRRAQVRYRGAPRARTGADELADLAEPVLTSIRRQYGIAEILRVSFATLGHDGNGRQERTDNFIITLDNEEAKQP